MSKLVKVGDKVQRLVPIDGKIMRGKVVKVVKKGTTIDIDIEITQGVGDCVAGTIYRGSGSFWEVLEEPDDDELPPVPDKVAYMNSKRDRGNDQRLVLEKDNGGGEGLMYIGVIPRKGSTRAQEEIGINIDPDSALQLAHDLRRMAMSVKREQK
ncbi:hypothetical protein [Klebsiella phage SDFMU_Pkc]|uniref:Uncharacterized protein n=1 Tax=Klebsiella phage KXP TaxID=2961976 RepID=A0A9E8G8X0_9CAUD|nr:hypothetical protein [Klebsiella phage KXP]WNO29493.1 hypothetical protein [Klebsiella phage SDFMU_Pkc]